MDKKCSKCQDVLDISQFAWKNKAKGLYSSNCRLCQKTMRRKHYLKNKDVEHKRIKERKLELTHQFCEYKKTLSCVKCGMTDYRCLDFHHNTGVKNYNVSEMPWRGISFENILKEINLCEVLCANCHRIEHYCI